MNPYSIRMTQSSFGVNPDWIDVEFGIITVFAGMSKLVYEHVSEACGVTRESSSLSSGTVVRILVVDGNIVR